jgi:hypothetical protein
VVQTVRSRYYFDGLGSPPAASADRGDAPTQANAAKYRGWLGAFEMLPIREDDNFIDLLLEKNEAFRRLLEDRQQKAIDGNASSIEEVLKRLNGPGTMTKK